MGVTPAGLSEHTGTRVSALVGADVLAGFDMLIDPVETRITLTDTEQDLVGEVLSLDFVMGIPVVEAHLEGRTIRMFFDTGAKLSYLSPDLTTGLPCTGRERDFYPGAGEFEVDVFDVPLRLGRAASTLRVGHLPELLQMTLMMADTSGILGTEILSEYALCYAPRRRSLALRRLSGG